VRIASLRTGDRFVWDADLGECEALALYTNATNQVVLLYKLGDGSVQAKLVPENVEVDLIDRTETLPE
jgi:hypothetical protein